MKDRRGKYRVEYFALRSNKEAYSAIIDTFAFKEIAKREDAMGRNYDVDQLDALHKGHSENNKYIVCVPLPSFPNSGLNRITTETADQARAFECRSEIFKISMWPHIKPKKQKLNKSGRAILWIG